MALPSKLLVGSVAISFVVGGETTSEGAVPDRLIAYRIDNSVVSSTAPVFLDGYSLAGTIEQTYSLPTATSGADLPLFGISTSEDQGQLSISPDGRYVTLAGYAAPASGLSSNSATNPAFPSYKRVVGRLDLGSGTVSTSTVLGDSTVAGSVRDAISAGSGQVWVSSSNGLLYTNQGANEATASLTTTSTRGLAIVGDTLYTTTSGGAAGRRVQRVSGSLPTSGPVTLTGLNSTAFPVGSTPNGFQLFDVNPSVAGVDVAFVADSSPGSAAADDSRSVMRYDFNGTDWVATYNLKTFIGTPSTSNVSGGALDVAGYLNAAGNPVLFVTTADGRIVRFDDTALPSIAPTFSTIVTAVPGRVFRGIVLVPEPASLSLLGLGALALGRRRRG